MTLFDTHCHLDDPRLAAELPDVLSRAESAGVRAIATIGCARSVETVRSALAEAGSGGINESEFKFTDAVEDEIVDGDASLDVHREVLRVDIRCSCEQKNGQNHAQEHGH